MHRPPLRLAVLPLVALLLAGCGDAVDRPVVVATWPASATTLPGPLQEIRIDFDEPVTILNPGDLAVFTDVGRIAVFAFQRAGLPNTLFVAPLFGVAFPPAVGYTVEIDEGLVVNADEHYLADEYLFSFEAGPPGPVLLGTPAGGRVVLADPVTLSEVGSTPTPGGRRPVGVLGTWVGTVPRVFTQLATGGASAESLAWFGIGDAAMTPVSLTHAGDLTADAGSLVLGPDGREVYAAWRDEGLGKVRVARIDALTGLETGSLVLSPAASGSTGPTGATLDGSRSLLLVGCRAASGDRLCQIDLSAFVEVDAGPDPGVDGLPLASGAGPVAAGGSDDAFLAPPASATALLTVADLPTGTTSDTLSPQVGQPAALAQGRDFSWLLEGLAGYAGQAGLTSYRTGLPTAGAPVDVSDHVGANPTGSTAVRAVGADPFAPRFLVLLNSDVIATFTWTDAAVLQTDADLATDGIQATALPPSALGADVVGFFAGAVPPP